MKPNFLIGLFFFLFSLTPAFADVKYFTPEQQKPFHNAESEMERMLDRILWRSDCDFLFDDYVFSRTERNTINDYTYNELVTPELVSSIAQFEKDLVLKQCGGTYLDDAICGYDANPLTCGQDMIDHMYLTTKQEPNSVWISAIIEGQDPQYVGARYRLIKNGRHWTLDGVDCVHDANFNYH